MTASHGIQMTAPQAVSAAVIFAYDYCAIISCSVRQESHERDAQPDQHALEVGTEIRLARVCSQSIDHIVTLQCII